MTNIINALLNTLFVSIPEQFILVILTLLFLKRFDLLDLYRWKENIKWVAIPVAPTAIAINFFKYILNINMNLIVSIIFIYLMVYIVQKTNILEIKGLKTKTILYSILSTSITIIFPEMLYVPFLLKFSNMTMQDINNNIFYNFMYSLPIRFLSIFICILVYWQKNRNEYDIIKNIIKNKILLITSTTFICLISMATLIVGYSFLNNNKVFKSLPQYLQSTLGIFMLSFSIVLVVIYFIPIKLLISQIKNLNQSHQNMLDDDI